MKVYLSRSAGDQISQIIDYLEEQWSIKVRNNFIDKLHRSMETISRMPYSYPESERMPGLRKCVITPHTIDYYRIDDIRTEVEIITIIDSRQNTF